MAMEINVMPPIERGKPEQKASTIKEQKDKDFFNIISALINPAPIKALDTPEMTLQDYPAVLSPILPLEEQAQDNGADLLAADAAATGMIAVIPNAGDSEALALTKDLSEREADGEKAVLQGLPKQNPVPDGLAQAVQEPRQEHQQQINPELNGMTPGFSNAHLDIPDQMKEEKAPNIPGIPSGIPPEIPPEIPQAMLAAEEGGKLTPGEKGENPVSKAEQRKELKSLTLEDMTEKTEKKTEKAQGPSSHQMPNEKNSEHSSLDFKALTSQVLAKGEGGLETFKVAKGSGITLPAEKLASELPGIIDSKLMSGVKGNNKSLVIHLEPKELGKLMVKLSDQDGVITLRIVTDNPETRAIVQNSLPDLRVSFSENGIKYGRLDVELGGESLQQHQQQSQQHQHQHQNQQNPHWSAGPSFINPKPWQDNYIYSVKEIPPLMARSLGNQGEMDYTV